MAEGLGEITATLDRLGQASEEAVKAAGRKIGEAGRRELIVEAGRVFGADRRFSGARGSRTAGGQAGASYKAGPDRVVIYPTGDPWYIFLKGRGRSNIAPKRKRALRTPYGARRRVHGGRLAPRPPSLLDPPAERTATAAAKILADTIIETAARTL